ncbi:MAG: low specificity L-threonine aldolase, partial [Rikenellaceae bacterium]
TFASDNYSGIHPNILDAIALENTKAPALSYGNDPLSQEVTQIFKDIIGQDATPFFVFNGTGANILSLQALSHSFEAIICADTAHINTDECGAPEFFTRSKLITTPSRNGKITAADIHKVMKGIGDQHSVQPKILSISQPTERGTVYTIEEIKSLTEVIHSYGGFIHIDGSRIANAAAALSQPIKAFTSDLNIDALSFGGTKNGMLMGEAVVLFDKQKSENFKFTRKQSGQLFSKTRFVAAQYKAYFKDDLYLKMAAHANEMAQYLAKRLSEISEITITSPVESNTIFAILPKEMSDIILKDWYFYMWNENINEARLMCSFSTTKETIDAFINACQYKKH